MAWFANCQCTNKKSDCPHVPFVFFLSPIFMEVCLTNWLVISPCWKKSYICPFLQISSKMSKYFRSGPVMMSVPLSLSSVGVISHSGPTHTRWPSVNQPVGGGELQTVDGDRCSLTAPQLPAAGSHYGLYIHSEHKPLKGTEGTPPPQGGHESSSYISAHSLLAFKIRCHVHSKRQIPADATRSMHVSTPCHHHSQMMQGQLCGCFLKGQSCKKWAPKTKTSSDELLYFQNAWDNVFSAEPAFPVKQITIVIYQWNVNLMWSG